jgi:chromosomal replication initiation ATPase DnaA
MTAQPPTEIFTNVAGLHPPLEGLSVTTMMVAQVYRVPLGAVMASTRHAPRAAEARQVAMYLAHVVFRMNMAAIARGFGRDRTTVRHACRNVERLREDPERDRLVARLEILLRDPCGATALELGQ